MKAYITCPVSHSSERLNLLPEIEKTVKENNIDAFVFQVGGDPNDIFKRDYEQLKSCNIIIAEVSETSHGVGIEIGISYCLGLKIILLLEKGKHVTKLAQGIPNISIIEYENLDNLKEKLSVELKKLKN
jgi:nucleoside 2-deoxyribosyltransferase